MSLSIRTLLPTPQPLRPGRLAAIALAALLSAGAPGRLLAASVYLEQMTSPELRDRVRAGATTILIPIGGTEQNGPHMALGKHNVRAGALAGRIAEKLGNAIVAPVIAYVPEGATHPPTQHMRFAGTISIPDAAFEGILEGAARSFKAHGFRDVVFLGDHGGYQASDAKVAARLDHEWANDPTCRVHALAEYYRVTETSYVQALKSRGYSNDEIGTHAGLADTSLTLAVDPALVRTDLMSRPPKASDGVYGDPRRSSAELGRLGVEQIVNASVEAIRSLTRPR
jgi:creatinine amidohydrolase/Fe(II)-dependent formamide hydrolase-like protein